MTEDRELFPSVTCPLEERHYKWKDKENEEDAKGSVDGETKKEFNDLSKLRADQKKSMKRAKDMLKEVFSESESSESEDETGDGKCGHLGKFIDVEDADMT